MPDNNKLTKSLENINSTKEEIREKIEKLRKISSKLENELNILLDQEVIEEKRFYTKRIDTINALSKIVTEINETLRKYYESYHKVNLDEIKLLYELNQIELNIQKNISEDLWLKVIEEN